jgi:hypothetical protein
MTSSKKISPKNIKRSTQKPNTSRTALKIASNPTAKKSSKLITLFIFVIISAIAVNVFQILDHPNSTSVANLFH